MQAKNIHSINNQLRIGRIFTCRVSKFLYWEDCVGIEYAYSVFHSCFIPIAVNAFDF
jgi:hypothetical protein